MNTQTELQTIASHPGDELPSAATGQSGYIADYFQTLQDLLASADVDAIGQVADLLYKTYQENRRLVLCGNGGSGSTTSHLVCDFMKNIYLDGGKPFEVIALTDSPALLLAWGNDTNFENVFAGQARTWLRKDDVLIVVSGSGNSKNILEVVAVAQERGAHTVGFCGYGGGKLSYLVDYPIVVHKQNMQQVEDMHMIFGHLLFSLLRDRVTGRLAA